MCGRCGASCSAPCWARASASSACQPRSCPSRSLSCRRATSLGQHSRGACGRALAGMGAQAWLHRHRHRHRHSFDHAAVSKRRPYSCFRYLVYCLHAVNSELWVPEMLLRGAHAALGWAQGAVWPRVPAQPRGNGGGHRSALRAAAGAWHSHAVSTDSSAPGSRGAPRPSSSQPA